MQKWSAGRKSGRVVSDYHSAGPWPSVPSKSRWQMCVLMDESVHCQLSCPLAHFTSFVLLIPSPGLSLNQIKCSGMLSATDSHFSFPFSLSLS